MLLHTAKYSAFVTVHNNDNNNKHNHGSTDLCKKKGMA